MTEECICQFVTFGNWFSSISELEDQLRVRARFRRPGIVYSVRGAFAANTLIISFYLLDSAVLKPFYTDLGIFPIL